MRRPPRTAPASASCARPRRSARRPRRRRARAQPPPTRAERRRASPPARARASSRSLLAIKNASCSRSAIEAASSAARAAARARSRSASMDGPRADVGASGTNEVGSRGRARRGRRARRGGALAALVAGAQHARTRGPRTVADCDPGPGREAEARGRRAGGARGLSSGEGREGGARSRAVVRATPCRQSTSAPPTSRVSTRGGEGTRRQKGAVETSRIFIQIAKVPNI